MGVLDRFIVIGLSQVYHIGLYDVCIDENFPDQ